MILKFDTTLIEDPCELGELLRNYCFKDRVGCVNCFELINGFYSVPKNTLLGEEVLRLLNWIPQHELGNACKDGCFNRKWLEDTNDFIFHEAQIFSNDHIHIAWLNNPDDTILIFITSGRILYNYEAQYPYDWRFITTKVKGEINDT